MFQDWYSIKKIYDYIVDGFVTYLLIDRSDSSCIWQRTGRFWDSGKLFRKRICRDADPAAEAETSEETVW